MRAQFRIVEAPSGFSANFEAASRPDVSRTGLVKNETGLQSKLPGILDI
jgi:hypothetical protein